MIGDLKRTGSTTQEVSRASEKLKREFNALGNKLQETSKLTLDSNGRWKDAEGNILNTQQASKRLEKSLSDVSDEQLKQIRVFRDAEGKLQDVRGRYISNSEAARRFAQGIEKTSREFAQADREARKFSNTLTRHRSELRNVALGAAAFTAGLGFVGKSFVQAAIRMEGYRNGLIALEGSAEAADTRLNSLRDIIQLPGVSYEGATQAAVRLKTIGFEAELADRSIAEFGNALALVGSTDLSGALLGLQQIISRGKVSQEEINQIVERSGLFANALQKAFGSIQSEQIQANLDAAGQSVHDFAERFISELEKLNRVDANSAANSIQNLQNSLFELRAGLGNVLLPTVTSVTQGLTSGINAFNEMDEGMKSAIVTTGAVVTGLGALTTVVASGGAALGAFNAYLTTTTGASGLAGFAKLIAPSGPVLIGLGAVTLALSPVVAAFLEYREELAKAREQERLFADALNKSAAALKDRSFDSAIRELQQYKNELEETIRIEYRRRGERGAGILGAEDIDLTETETIARSSFQSVERLLEVFNQLRSGTRLSIDQIREFDSVVARSLFAARQEGNDSVVSILESTAQHVRALYAEFETGGRRIQRGVTEPTRNFKLELVDLRAKLLDAEDAFRNIQDVSDLESVTQSYRGALEAVTQVRRDEIEAQIAVEGTALARLDNQKRAESEHAKTIGELAVQLRQLEVDYERDKTRITREEVKKRTELSESAAQQRIDATKREVEEHRRSHESVFAQIEQTLRDMENVGQRDRTAGIFNRLVGSGAAPRDAFEQAQNFVALTDGIENSMQRLETSIYVFSALFRREFTGALQSGVAVLNGFQQSLRETRLSDLAEDVRESDVLSRLEDGQAARDQRTADIFAAGAASFREQDRNDTDQALAFVASLQRQQAFDRGRLIADAGDLVGAVPLDVVDAVTDIVQVRRDANAELITLEQETAAEIQHIQESVTLTAENKAKAIERIERQSALQRIQIENAVSERQRASFQSVVTNFISGVGRMIAAEAQLALARRATNALSSLFGGGAAAGAGLLGGVALPLVGGLALAYGASQLIAPSSPSADVYESSQFGVSGDGANRNVQTSGLTRAGQESDSPVQQTSGLTRAGQKSDSPVQQTSGLSRAGQESDSPVLEANINVNVEASGTRLGQANERVKLKTERWGG